MLYDNIHSRVYIHIYVNIFIIPCDKHSTLEYIECNDNDDDDDDDDNNNIVVAAALFAAARNSILPVNPFVRVANRPARPAVQTAKREFIRRKLRRYVKI